MNKKAIVKLDGGKITILCSKCRVVVKNGSEVNQEIIDKIFKNELQSQYCKNCKKDESL
jgi:hypothetical protein